MRNYNCVLYLRQPTTIGTTQNLQHGQENKKNQGPVKKTERDSVIKVENDRGEIPTKRSMDHHPSQPADNQSPNGHPSGNHRFHSNLTRGTLEL